jgi:hypothetical protein
MAVFFRAASDVDAASGGDGGGDGGGGGGGGSGVGNAGWAASANSVAAVGSAAGSGDGNTGALTNAGAASLSYSRQDASFDESMFIAAQTSRLQRATSLDPSSTAAHRQSFSSPLSASIGGGADDDVGAGNSSPSRLPMHSVRRGLSGPISLGEGDESGGVEVGGEVGELLSTRRNGSDGRTVDHALSLNLPAPETPDRLTRSLDSGADGVTLPPLVLPSGSRPRMKRRESQRTVREHPPPPPPTPHPLLSSLCWCSTDSAPNGCSCLL